MGKSGTFQYLSKTSLSCWVIFFNYYYYFFFCKLVSYPDNCKAFQWQSTLWEPYISHVRVFRRNARSLYSSIHVMDAQREAAWSSVPAHLHLLIDTSRIVPGDSKLSPLVIAIAMGRRLPCVCFLVFVIFQSKTNSESCCLFFVSKLANITGGGLISEAEENGPKTLLI